MKRLPIYIIVMVVAFIAASFLSAKLNKEQLKFALPTRRKRLSSSIQPAKTNISKTTGRSRSMQVM